MCIILMLLFLIGKVITIKVTPYESQKIFYREVANYVVIPYR